VDSTEVKVSHQDITEVQGKCVMLQIHDDFWQSSNLDTSEKSVENAHDPSQADSILNLERYQPVCYPHVTLKYLHVVATFVLKVQSFSRPLGSMHCS
jgi:hypothetical protein